MFLHVYSYFLSIITLHLLNYQISSHQATSYSLFSKKMASSIDESPLLPTAPVLASFGITQQEMDALVPVLEGFGTGQIADVIWDAITDIGFDDVSEGVGVFFGREEGEGNVQQDDSLTSVIFWDREGPMKLPKKAFLQILELIAVFALTSSKIVTDPSMSEEEREHEQMKEEMNRGRLRIAMMVLQKKISSNASFEGSLSYRYSVDSGFEDESNVAGLVQQAQCRWDHGVKRNRKNSLEGKVRKGVEGALEGRPIPKENKGSFNERILAKVAAVKMFTPRRRRLSFTQSEDGRPPMDPLHEEPSDLSLERLEEGANQEDTK